MLVLDPCGVVCVLFTYCSVLYGDYVVMRWIIMETMHESLWGTVNAVLFNTVVTLLVLAHCKAVFSDPGVVPLPRSRVDFSDLQQSRHSSRDHGVTDCDNEDWTICMRCETYRPPRAHHCRICRRCIKRMDHHCPWINNCVGERNQKYFIQFLVYVALLSLYSIGLILFSWLRNCQDCDIDVPTKQRRMMHSVMLFCVSTLFGLFVSVILMDQVQSIVSDETQMETGISKRGPYRPLKPKMALMSEVCGRQHPLLWLLPCSAAPRKFDTPLINHYV